MPNWDPEPDQIERKSVYPAPKEEAIRIVIQIILNFYDAKSKEETGEPLSDDDKEKKSSELWEFFRGFLMNTASSAATQKFLEMF